MTEEEKRRMNELSVKVRNRTASYEELQEFRRLGAKWVLLTRSQKDKKK